MALKFVINKSAYEALSDDMKKEYSAGDKDGEFVLDVLDLPKGEDVAPIKRALEKERSTNKTLKAERDGFKEQLDAAPNVDELKANHEKEVGKLKAFADKSLRESVASDLASKISTAPALLKPIILGRLAVDMDGDEPVTKVLGPDGKVSDMTIDKLREELVANKDYGTIMIGSKAKGGGAPTTTIKPGGGGAPTDGNPQADNPDLSTMKPGDFVARIAARKEAEAAASQQAT
jgi:hypothetical protein